MNDALVTRTTITIDTSALPLDFDSWWLDVRSERNRTISRTTDVAEAAPPSEHEPRTWDGPVHWFPVIDVDLAADWTAHVRFSGTVPGDTVVVNGYRGEGAFATYSEAPVAVSHRVLQHWENSIFVPHDGIAVEEFWARRRIPVGAETAFRALGPAWQGEVRIVGLRQGVETEIKPWTPISGSAEKAGRPGPAASPRHPLPQELSAVDNETIEHRLSDLVGWIVGSVNDTPGHITEKGFHLFYDLQAGTYRTPQWMWTWGPSIKLLLDCAAAGQATSVAPPSELASVGLGAAYRTLDFLADSPDHPACGLIKVRWNVRHDSHTGYLGYFSPADTGFLAGWGWVPAYQASGDPVFVDVAYGVVQAIDKLADVFGVPPMDYIEDTLTWKDFTLDEAGFAPECHAALHAVTGDESVVSPAVKLMNNLLDRYESPSALWHRQYNYRDDVLKDVAKEARGQGWAMEGLLALDRMVPDDKYRESALRMAREMIRDQRSDGSWLTITDGSVQDHGVSEKGTALWSLLLYMLYQQTGEVEFLDPARRALKWCLDNQYYGPDPHGRGGIPGATPNSGVVYREWFPLICGYTCAFAGLAMMKELEIRSSSADV